MLGQALALRLAPGYDPRVRRGRLTFAAVLSAAGLALGCGASALGSPPGQASHITFVRGSSTSPETVWLANADGSGGHPLARGDAGLLSPNGAYVAVQRVGSSGHSLELYSTRGKLIASYYDAAKDTATALAWSPDSRYLAVSLTDTSAVGRGTLALIDTTTLRSRLVTKGAISGASFNPAATQLVFGRSNSEQITAPVNLYTAAVGGGAPHALTANGNSFDPLWTRNGIVFDRSTSRGVSRAPVFQLWLYAGGGLRQLTHLRVQALVDGLSPIAASDDGNRVLAEFTGQDTSYAWTVQLAPLRIRPLLVDGKQVQGSQISSDGRRVLVDTGAFENPPDRGTVQSVGFDGADPVRLARGAQPSWNR